MAKGDKPWGTAWAIIPNPNTQNKDNWVKVGPVWQNDDGSFTAVLEAEPVAWGSPRCERRLQFRKRAGRSSGGAPQDDDE
jgi:hypothetical protein